MRITARTRKARRIAGVASVCALALAPPPAGGAAQAATPAGQMIRNVATLTAGTRQVSSNEVLLTVAHVVDVAVGAAVASRAKADVAREDIVFSVRNTGNADERYLLSAAGAPDGVTIAGIVADGLSGAAIVLAAGEERRVVVTVEGARDIAGDVAVSLTATAATAHGTPGDQAGDAIVGPGGARATARTMLTRGGGALPPAPVPTLAKSQSVVAPDGSARVTAGSVVTYRLEASFPAATPAVAIDDAIPAGTSFVAGSMRLDGAAQSDAADADAARFDGAAIHVGLGDLPAGTTRIVQFQVRIR